MKIAVVTGASSGLGKEFARQIPHLYKKLDEIWVVARRENRLKILAERMEERERISVRIFAGDLAKDSVYERLASALC